jgi:hypothetical protein
MAPALRPARIAALEAQIEADEYLEELLVQREIENGRPVDRRSRANPAAVLGVKIVERARRVA